MRVLYPSLVLCLQLPPVPQCSPPCLLPELQGIYSLFEALASIRSKEAMLEVGEGHCAGRRP